MAARRDFARDSVFVRIHFRGETFRFGGTTSVSEEAFWMPVCQLLVKHNQCSCSFKQEQRVHSEVSALYMQYALADGLPAMIRSVYCSMQGFPRHLIFCTGDSLIRFREKIVQVWNCFTKFMQAFYTFIRQVILFDSEFAKT